MNRPSSPAAVYAGVAPRLAVALAVLLALGCVTRGTYDREVARAEALEQALDEKSLRIAELERHVQDLQQTGETLELERSSLEEERLKLLESIEQLRSGNARLRIEVEEERELRKQREEEIQSVAGTYRELVEQLESEVAAGNIEIHRLQGKLQVRALEGILFDSGSARIKPRGAEVLAKIAEQVSRIPDHRVRVEGHTDSIPIATDRYPSNWELAVARAAVVVRFLVDHGVEADKLVAAGYGPFAPIADNETAEGRARNRRIEIVLVPEGEE